jgi:TetR/AcrR family transcriptional regulator, repressor for neighboring sulfatase
MRKKPTPTPRTRRKPEEARRLILDAARDLIAAEGPDAIGLKDIAARAGISHGLITHYFGTYDALVDATFADHIERTRRAIAARSDELAAGGPGAWVELAADHVGDPVYGKLLAWAFMSGRFDQGTSVPRRLQGLRYAAEAMRGGFASTGKRVSREDIEFAILLVMSTLTGYALGRGGWWAALGKGANAERDAWYRGRLVRLLEQMLT